MATKTAVDGVTTYNTRDLLGTGSTLLNLACTGYYDGGFLPGKYYFIVGDSTSGKTFVSMTCLAEATLRKRFKNYRFIYDNVEDGMMMDLDRLFNEQVADRMEPPASDKAGEPIFSDTIESFYYNLDDAIHQAGWDSKKRKPSDVKDPKPFIYILDSMDSIDSEAGDKKFDQQKQAYRKAQNRAEKGGEADGEKEEKVSGSYGMDKAKINSTNLRKCMKGLRKTNSILIVLSQTRDDPNAMYVGQKTRAGGKALRFYATTEIWTSVVKTLKKNYNGKDREIGKMIKAEIKKSRLVGLLRTVEFPIHPSFGIDDLGSCVDFLVSEGWWSGGGKKAIVTKDLQGISGTRERVIRKVEEKGLEREVRRQCGECWKSIEDALKLKRKNKYTHADKADSATAGA